MKGYCLGPISFDPSGDFRLHRQKALDVQPFGGSERIIDIGMKLRFGDRRAVAVNDARREAPGIRLRHGPSAFCAPTAPERPWSIHHCASVALLLRRERMS